MRVRVVQNKISYNMSSKVTEALLLLKKHGGRAGQSMGADEGDGAEQGAQGGAWPNLALVSFTAFLTPVRLISCSAFNTACSFSSTSFSPSSPSSPFLLSLLPLLSFSLFRSLLISLATSSALLCPCPIPASTHA
ncbi:unnamed protein product [Closterium sp. NIES-65]|nr:unnamed protein product [Closterium sp. NIES-65]